jgi:tripartite-type tricarboxylate transporter receptor subunit TctC
MKLPRPALRMADLVIASLAIAAALEFAPSSATSVYPLRPITIIVPFTAGGQGDVVIRILAERMRTSLSQSVIIDNVGGATGSIGTGRVARAAPDGYTLGQGSLGTHVVNGAARALNFDVVKDFEPIALIASGPQLIVAKKTMPANDLKEFIGWLKANPDKATQGTTGVGGISHLAGVFFQKQTGTRFGFVPYRGTAMQDLVAGNIDLMIDQAATAVPQLRAGASKPTRSLPRPAWQWHPSCPR